MGKSKKSMAREKSPTVGNEIVKKKQTPKSRTSQSRGRKPSQARSKSRSRKGAHSKVRGRTRSRSRSRSRSKSKSPKRRGRPRSRSRSKSLKRTPTTRSAARSKSRSKKTETAVIKELVDIVQQSKPTIEHKDNYHNFLPKETKLNEIIRRSISRELSQEKINNYRLPTHASLLPNLNELEPKHIDGLNRNFQKHTLTLKKTNSWSFSIPDWFKATFGLVVLPLTVLMLHLACKYNQCILTNLNIPQKWTQYFSYEAAAIIFGFLLIQALLSLLPIGKKVGGPTGVNGTLQYRCNGLLCTFLTVGLVAGLWQYQFPITIVYDKLIPLLCSSVIFAYILGLILFIKGGRAPVPALNPASIVGSRFYQFFVGREVNPFFFGKINIKILLIRTSLNGMLLINGIMALKYYIAKHELSYALGTSVGLNALLIFDFFWFESSFPSTFEAMYEGTGGSFALRYFLYPFLPALITKYIILRKSDLPLWGLVGIAIGFTIGFIIHRASNLQKAAFRKCPLNPALSQLEAISTNRGKKLLVTGWWGWVRHPNYLGFIILHWAWASAAGFSNAVPHIVPFIITILMMLRARRVDKFCGHRYQSSWEEYCSRVRYRIFPRVY